MVLYTVTGKVGEEGYLDIAKSGDLTGKNIYVNMTNKCPCSCVFCLRQTKKQQENNTLWLKDGEPSIEEVLELFSKYDLNIINELVFCGFGEPLERLEDVCAVIDSLKNTYPNLKVRLNTIGLANLIYGRDVTPELEGRFDTVSISLNAPDENEFLELTRSRYGIQSYAAIKDFAVLAKGAQLFPLLLRDHIDEGQDSGDEGQDTGDNEHGGRHHNSLSFLYVISSIYRETGLLSRQKRPAARAAGCFVFSVDQLLSSGRGRRYSWAFSSPFRTRRAPWARASSSSSPG